MFHGKPQCSTLSIDKSPYASGKMMIDTPRYDRDHTGITDRSTVMHIFDRRNETVCVNSK